jgi:TrmH family RNA methyltransferase
MTKHITSLQNPLIKNIVQLSAKARERKAQGLFVAEGLREVGLALRNGYHATALLFDETSTSPESIEELLENATTPPDEIIPVSAAVFEKIAYRSGIPNVVGIFLNSEFRIPNSEFRIQNVPLFLVVERVEKPGNLGAMLRTADAAGVSGVFVCDPLADPFNPNVIRASLGAVFTVPVFTTDSQTAAEWLKKQGIRIIATHLEAARSLYECDLTQPLAFVLGAEATGISGFWVEQADERIIIPMQGQVDSLNVSASAAVVVFEAVRQRVDSAKSG